MNLVLAGVAQSFEVSFYPALNESAPLPVGYAVYDTTNGTPTLVQGPSAMTYIAGTNTYTAQFTPVLNHNYVIIKSVYTDGTFTAFDPNYDSGSESWTAIANPSTPPNPPSVSSIIGIVNNNGSCNGYGFPIFSMFLGDVIPLPLKAMYAQTYNPLDLTDCTEIVVSITNADGTQLQLTLTDNDVTIVGNPMLGQFVANWTSAESALFLVGPNQNIDVVFTIGSETVTIRYMNCFSVYQVP
jgi:hypothetical protein